MPSLILLQESTAVRCTDLPLQKVSARAIGHKKCLPLAQNLEFEAHYSDYRRDRIDPVDACILAARLLLHAGKEICQDCPNIDRINSDYKVNLLRNNAAGINLHVPDSC